MPPKKSQNVSKKTENKQKEKILEDKTFGLKNKKGAKQQKYIAHVTAQVKHQGQSMQKLKDQEFEKKKQKEKQQQEIAALNALFKSVEQTCPTGVDPKSVICEMFKKAKCTKGAKCKFSHDLNINRKSEKKNLYEDVRDNENINDIEPDALNEMIEKKHGASNASRTNIVCKHFLDAVEKKLYGWFWQCPNGDGCKYRHALPPGYELKSKAKQDATPKNVISLEELIEKERSALGSNLTKITLESFLQWKKRKLTEKKKVFEQQQEKKKNDFKAGRAMGLSGREMFTFNPDLISDRDDADEDEDTVCNYERDSDDEAEGDAGPVREVNLEDFVTNIADDDIDKLPNGATADPQPNAPDQISEGAVGGELTNDEDTSNQPLEINEELFNEDLEDLEDLESLDLND